MWLFTFNWLIVNICNFKWPFVFFVTFVSCLGLDGVEVICGAKFEDVSSKLYLLPVSNKLRHYVIL